MSDYTEPRAVAPGHGKRGGALNSTLHNLCVLCASAVEENGKSGNRRGAEDAEVTQRSFKLKTRSSRRYLETPLVMLSLFAGAAFLTKMCYLSLAFNTIFVLVFLALFYFYIRIRLNIQIPVTLLGLVFLALQVDALGNFFHMYGQQFGPMQYDEFAHTTVQVLVSPIIVWLTGRVLQQLGYRLPLRLSAFFAATIVFSLSAVYEIIELWDEIYFGGHRIWGPYDTATDLQWDLCGIIVGTLFSCIMLRDTRDRLVSH